MIRTSAELQTLCTALQTDGLAAIDTEFVWNRTLHPRLGLIQLGSSAGDGWALDVLTGANPEALAGLVADAGTVKILHDAHQDLYHIHRYTHACPKNVFDTRLAAGFAGFPSILGLQKLLEEALNVGLPKTETLTDWCARPLTAAQLEYALDDVRYLAALRATLLQRARELGTLPYLEEELRHFDDPARYADPDPREAWQSVKGIGRLKPASLAALRELAAVRERTAEELNIPRPWVADDDSLVALSEKGVPRDARDLFFRNRLHNRGQRDTIASRFLVALRTAAALRPEEYPTWTHLHVSTELRARADEALVFLRERAGEVHIDAPLFCNRATLTQYLHNPEDATNPLTQGWRYELVGRDLATRFIPPTLF